MKKNKNKLDLVAGVYDLCNHKSEEALAFVWEQWKVLNDHEQRVRKMEAKLLELQDKLLEEKKQVHHLGRVHEF